MDTKRDLGLLGSSTDSTQLGAMVSGLIVTFSAVIILVLGKFGIMIDNAGVTALASQAGLAIGAIWTLYGLVRKLLIKVAVK